MNTYDMKIKTVLTDESIKKMMGSVSPEEVKREVIQELKTKTSREIEVEIKNHGSEQSYIKSLIPAIIAKIVLHKVQVAAGVLGVGSVGVAAAAATPSMAAQFADFQKLKSTDLDNISFLTDQQKDLLLNSSNVDATDIASNISTPDIDIDSGGDDLVSNLIDIASTIAIFFGIG